MPRPHKLRTVDGELEVCFFKPTGTPMRDLDVVELGEDELEAIRLADLEGLYQADAAERMGVSRPTFGNIVSSAHKKIAEALTQGKAIQIAGGPVERCPKGGPRKRCCRRHGHGDSKDK